MTIKLDFIWSVAIISSFVPVLVMFAWIFYTSKQDQGDESSKNLEQCPFCTYLFFKFNTEIFTTCPRCESLISGDKKSSVK